MCHDDALYKFRFTYLLTDEVLGVTVDEASSFVYLGSIVTNDANCADEVKLKTSMCRAVMVKLTKKK